MKIRKDILGRTPKIGDTVAFNPALYKGLVFGVILNFKTSSGLPLVRLDSSFNGYYGISELYRDDAGLEQIAHVPKTGFVIV